MGFKSRVAEEPIYFEEKIVTERRRRWDRSSISLSSSSPSLSFSSKLFSSSLLQISPRFCMKRIKPVQGRVGREEGAVCVEYSKVIKIIVVKISEWWLVKAIGNWRRKASKKQQWNPSPKRVPPPPQQLKISISRQRGYPTLTVRKRLTRKPPTSSANFVCLTINMAVFSP